MYCNKCGEKISDDSTYCNYCGNKIEVLLQEEIESKGIVNTDDPKNVNQINNLNNNYKKVNVLYRPISITLIILLGIPFLTTLLSTMLINPLWALIIFLPIFIIISFSLIFVNRGIKPTRVRGFTIITCIMFLMLIGSSIGFSNIESKKDNTLPDNVTNSYTTVTTENTVSVTTVEATTEEKSTGTESTNIIKYRIIYTVYNARFDGGTKYYLLINPVDLSNDGFKDGIKDIVRRFIKIHGNKVSLNIYDKLETLENDYKETEKMNTTVSTDPEYLKDIELHFIAYYDGDLSTGLYLNTLGFFPAYYYDNSVIEKYLEILEFNP